MTFNGIFEAIAMDFRATVASRVNELQLPSDHITRVLICVDLGTAFTECCFQVIYKTQDQNPRALDDSKFLSAKTTNVMWGNDTYQCPSQIAFRKSDIECDHALWGIEVIKALNKKEITESCILKHLKPLLYCDARSTSWHNNDLQQRLKDVGVRWTPVNSGDTQGDSSQEPQTNEEARKGMLKDAAALWELYQKQVFLFVVNVIWKQHKSDLPWHPPPQNTGKYTEIHPSMFGPCRVETGLTFPASATVNDVQSAITIAEALGMPNCFAISEPSAASASKLQHDFEKGRKFPEKQYHLFIDIGCGTVDIVAFGGCMMSEKRVTPVGDTAAKVFQLHELIPAQNKWCGVGIPNNELRRLLEKELEIDDIIEELNSLSSTSEEEWTRTRFLDKCENLFEEQKKEFREEDILGNHATYLRFSELGCLRKFRTKSVIISVQNGEITLPPQVMAELFEPCVNGIIELLRSQWKQIERLSKPPVGMKKQPPVIKDIQLVGGGAASEYISAKVQNAFRDLLSSRQIPFIPQTASSTESSLMICRGGLVLLADKDFMGDMITRRGYCFARGVKATAPSAKHEENRLSMCDVTGDLMKDDSAYWLCKVNERIRRHFENKMRGIRYLYSQCPERIQCEESGRNGWSIIETLWASDRPSDMKPDTWVESIHRKIVEVGKIQFILFENDLIDVPLRFDRRNKEYRQIEYESGFILEAFQTIRWFIRIPRSGIFTEFGQDYVEHRGELIDCRGNFQLFSPAGNTEEQKKLCWSCFNKTGACLCSESIVENNGQ